MSAPTSPSAAPGSATESAPGSGSRSSWRLWAAVALSVAAAVGLTVWQTSDPQYGARLDPRNPGADGGQAVARVLAEQGVQVDVVRSAAELADAAPDGDTTVLVTSTGALADNTVDDLRDRAARSSVVLVDPSHLVVERIDPGVATLPAVADDLAAGCVGAVPVDPADLRLTVDAATAYDAHGTPTDTGGCFPATGGYLLAGLTAPGTDGRTVQLWAFGAGDALTNDQVLRADNAAIALRLLGGRDRLVWYVADPADSRAGDPVTLTSLLPRGLVPSLWLVAAAVLAWMLHRGRRLGPLVSEPLPVVVRAVETTVSRGRMYRRSGDRAHAATALRDRAVRALSERLSLHRPAPDALVARVADRTERTAADVSALLYGEVYGEAPATEGELIRLAQELERLIQEVR